MSHAEQLLLAETLASAWMAAIIWTVHLFIYPAFAHVGTAQWQRHHARHSARITPLVLPPMLVQLAVPVLLLTRTHADAPTGLVWTLLVLGAATWIVTLAVSARCHSRMTDGRDAAAYALLLRSNVLRVILWSVLAVASTWTFVVATS